MSSHVNPELSDVSGIKVDVLEAGKMGEVQEPE